MDEEKEMIHFHFRHTVFTAFNCFEGIRSMAFVHVVAVLLTADMALDD